MSWSPLNDLLPNLAVNALALDPGDTNVLYAGTGEGFFNFRSGIQGAGIFKTENAGDDWDPVGGTDQSVDFHYVNDVVVSPVSSQRVYAATRTGVFRSLNAGGMWAQVLVSNAANGNYGCTDLAIRANGSADVLFAACGAGASDLQPPPQGHIWRNLDAGGARRLDRRVHGGGNETDLAGDRCASQPNIVYALSATVATGAFEDGLHAVFRSTTKGDPGSWTARVRNTSPVALNRVLLNQRDGSVPNRMRLVRGNELQRARLVCQRDRRRPGAIRTGLGWRRRSIPLRRRRSELGDGFALVVDGGAAQPTGLRTWRPARPRFSPGLQRHHATNALRRQRWRNLPDGQRRGSR